MLRQNAIVLFQGDSITDWGRDRNDYYSLGTGYAMMCGAWINSLHPELNITFLNRGIGGDSVGTTQGDGSSVFYPSRTIPIPFPVSLDICSIEDHDHLPVIAF